MRRGGTHFWQAPTALGLPPWGGGGAQLKRHPPTHQLTNTSMWEKISGAFGARNVALPLKPPTHSWWGGPIRRRHLSF